MFSRPLVPQKLPTELFRLPQMLVGVVSFNVLDTIDPSDTRAVGVLLVGYFFLGGL